MSSFPLKILSALITRIEKKDNVHIVIFCYLRKQEMLGEICVKGTKISCCMTCGQEGS